MMSFIMPKTMKAAILTELRKPLVVTDIELPKTLQIGQALVKVSYSGICGSQLGEIDGVKGKDNFLPHLLGHEATGVVIAIGPGVSHVKVDNKVVLHWRKGVGIESKTPSYDWNGKKVNAGWIATFNEYAIVSENRCTVIPDDSDLKVATLFGCAVTTGFGVVENNAKIRMGESAVVFGAGGIGLNIIQALDLSTAYPIIAVDQYSNRLQLAKKMGATHTINSSIEDVKKKILDIVQQDNGVDLFIDNTGKPAIIELGYEVTKPNGRVILVGVPHKGDNVNIHTLPLHFGKYLSGSHGGDGSPNLDIPRYHKLFRNDRIKLRELISDEFSLPEINNAIDGIRNGNINGRVVINMDI